MKNRTRPQWINGAIITTRTHSLKWICKVCFQQRVFHFCRTMLRKRKKQFRFSTNSDYSHIRYIHHLLPIEFRFLFWGPFQNQYNFPSPKVSDMFPDPRITENKVLLIGDKFVGKTQFALRFEGKTFGVAQERTRRMTRWCWLIWSYQVDSVCFLSMLKDTENVNLLGPVQLVQQQDLIQTQT